MVQDDLVTQFHFHVFKLDRKPLAQGLAVPFTRTQLLLQWAALHPRSQCNKINKKSLSESSTLASDVLSGVLPQGWLVFEIQFPWWMLMKQTFQCCAGASADHPSQVALSL